MPEIDLHLMSLLNHRCLCQSHLVVLLYPLVSLLLKILLSLYLIPEILHLTSLLKSLLSLPLWNLFAESPWYLTSLLLLLFLLPHHDQHRYIHIRNLHSQRTQNLSQRNAGLDVTDWMEWKWLRGLTLWLLSRLFLPHCGRSKQFFLVGSRFLFFQLSNTKCSGECWRDWLLIIAQQDYKESTHLRRLMEESFEKKIQYVFTRELVRMIILIREGSIYNHHHNTLQQW